MKKSPQKVLTLSNVFDKIVSVVRNTTKLYKQAAERITKMTKASLQISRIRITLKIEFVKRSKRNKKINTNN